MIAAGEAAPLGRLSQFGTDHERRFHPRPEALSRRLHERHAVGPHRARAGPARRRAGSGGSAAPPAPTRSMPEAQARTVAGGGKLVDQEKWKRPSTRSTPMPASRSRPRPAPIPSRRTISAGAITACSMSPRRRTATCAGCASPTASSRPGSSRASPISPSASVAATATSPPAPICRSARSRAEKAPLLLEGLADLGLTAKGSGADNIRNVTGSAAAGHRPARTARHAAPCPRLAPPHPQRPLALRPAAQVQRRLRRCRLDRDAGGHQRYRLPGRRDRRGRLVRGPGDRARHLVPPRARRHHRPPRPRPRHRHRRRAVAMPSRWRMRSCASSSPMATAPTAPRRG